MMTLNQLSKSLSSIYNTLGNRWLTENFETEPFDFRVYVRRGYDIDLTDFVAEVYTDRPFPKDFSYKEKQNADGIHYSVVQYKFKELAQYVDTFGDFRKTLGVELMDLINV
jgi:hypothetical protein